MKVQMGIKIGAGVVLAAVTVWVYGWYNAYSIADKACLNARVGAPADRAKAQLKAVAASRGVEVDERGDRTSVVFRWLSADVAGCRFVVRDGKIAEVSAGKRALNADK